MKITTTIPTLFGGSFDFENPLDNDLNIVEIAHALSNVCRFAGHCRKFYSVAQHAVLCSYVEPERDAYEKLMHDCAEAFLGDVTTPLKRMLPEYQRIEQRVELAIHLHFDLPTKAAEIDAPGSFNAGIPLSHVAHMPSTVKRVDVAMFATEKRDLLNKNNMQSLIKPLPFSVSPWGHTKSKHAFLERFYELCPDRFLTTDRWKHVWHHRLVSMINR